MHDGVLSEKPGTCPVCGMAMVPIQPGVRTVLHDAPYNLELFTTPLKRTLYTEPQADPLIRLVFKPSQYGQLLRDLPVVHEHPMHVTIVSDDLSYFDHVHPSPRGDGLLSIDYAFPHPGNYLVFAEFFPSGQRDQIFRFPLVVDAATAVAPPELEPAQGSVKPITNDPAMTAELITQPRTLNAGTHCMLLFRLNDHGQPVTDLQSYMGAMGHCAIISQDTQCFLHCHPEQLFPTTPDSRGGPEIAFHTAFPHAGKYKIWGQFKRNGKIVIADFVVQVKSSILPPKVINFILNDY